MRSTLGFKKLIGGKKKEVDADGPCTSSEGRAAAEEQITYHPDADENGGMLCTNDELLKTQREAILVWVKSMGKRLLTGNVNLINTPFPVTIFEPRSYLEKLADVWVYPRYLSAASQTSDPVERMKLVTTWFVAGLHHAFANWRKPFNPILGETWQARLSDGTSMYLEQISHHPPVSAFHMEGPGGSYRFRGLSQPTVSIQVKYYGFKTVAKGFRYVEFPDGTRIELHYPQYFIKNVVYGGSRPRAEVDGQAILVDVKNKLKTVIHFGALKGARNKVLRRTDAVYGYVYDCRNNQASLEEKTSTADLADTLEEVGHLHSHRSSDHSPASAAAREQRQRPPGGSSGGEGEEGGGGGEGDEFESASENEYDAEKADGEGGDGAAAAEEAAAEAELAELAAVAEAAAAAAAAEEDGGGAGAGGSPTRLGGGGDLRSSMGSANGDGGLAAAAAALGSGGGLHKLEGRSVSVSKSGPAPSSGSSSFFGMSALNSMGKLLRITQTPSASNVEPSPNEREGAPLATIQGSWLGQLTINGTRYWDVATERPDSWTSVPDPLPSDCRYRQDLVVLAGGDLKGAQHTKELLENRQRNDKKLREAAAAAAGGSKHGGTGASGRH